MIKWFSPALLSVALAAPAAWAQGFDYYAARADLDAELVRRRGRRSRRSVRPGPRPRLHPTRALAAVRGGLARGLRPPTPPTRHGARPRRWPTSWARAGSRGTSGRSTAAAPASPPRDYFARARRVYGALDLPRPEARARHRRGGGGGGPRGEPGAQPGRRDRDLSRQPDRGGAGLPHARARAARLRGGCRRRRLPAAVGAGDAADPVARVLSGAAGQRGAYEAGWARGRRWRRDRGRSAPCRRGGAASAPRRALRRRGGSP